jgi:O-glycosyl hydrolase
MQNEPDWLAGWDTCKFTPTESSSWAGYNKAFEALCAKMATVSNPPKMLAPESAGFIQLASYINNLFDRSPLYGYSHHLYNSNTGGNGSNPDGFIGDMTSFASQFADKPRMQTEFSAGETTFIDAMNLAKLMHNSLTVEDAAAYFHWDLFWAHSDGDSNATGLVTIRTPSYTYTINPVYWAFKHYSAFTDPNWQRLEADTNSSALRISAFVSPDNNQMSVIILNTSDVNISLDLSLGNFEVTDGNIYRTNSSLTEKCAFVGAFVENTPLTLPKNSITTVALRGILIPTNCQEVQDFGYGLPADLTGDCYVNYKDLKVISDYWLKTGCGDYNNCDGADFKPRDGIVNFFDFSDFAKEWMQCNNPEELDDCIPNW